MRLQCHVHVRDGVARCVAPNCGSRLESSQQYFELTAEQHKYLRDHGVDQKVINAMVNMNPEDNARTGSGGERS